MVSRLQIAIDGDVVAGFSMDIYNVVRNACLNAAFPQHAPAAENMVHENFFAFLVEKIVKLCRPQLIPRPVIAMRQEKRK